MQIFNKTFSWINDDKQTLHNFDISSIFAENLKCDKSLVQMFVPFQYAPLKSLGVIKKKPENLEQSNKSTSELSTDTNSNLNKIKNKYLFLTQSDSILKSIVKFYKKNKKGLSKTINKEKNIFTNLSLWHQKCITSVLPFSYCDQKNYSLVYLKKIFNKY
jgi:hypothetical protein